MKALARLVGPVPGHDHPIELQNLLLDTEQLSTERGKARTGNLRQPLVARVDNNMQQFRDLWNPIVVIVCMGSSSSPNSAHIHGTHVPVGEPSTASLPDSCIATVA